MRVTMNTWGIGSSEHRGQGVNWPRLRARGRQFQRTAVLAIGLVFPASPSLLAGNELVLTVTASAKGTAGLADVYSDNCSFTFTGRLVYRPDPKTGFYEVTEETYTLNASGEGKVSGAGSWTYIARQPGEGTVSLVGLDISEGVAYVTVAPLDNLVDVSNEEGNGVSKARSFCGSAQQKWGLDPDAGRINFPPNAAQFNAGDDGTGEDALPGLGNGQFSIHYNLSRGDEQVEAVIIPPPEYPTWLPEGSDDETIPGPKPFTVAVELRIPGTQTPPEGRRARFHFELIDTSREPGLCLNKPPKDQAATARDLLFLPGSGKVVSNEGQTLDATNLLSRVTAGIACFDYGASARLRVVATLDDDRQIVAHVEGDTGQTTLAIPQDENNNHIADGWEKARGVYARNLPDNWDGDDQPGGQDSDGDGISLFEDYRGFFFGRRHERLEPGFKHLFVYDRDGYVLETMKSGSGGINFAAAAGCRVRFVTDQTWTGSGAFAEKKRIVNFNHGRGHRVDQRAIEVQIVTETTPLDPKDWYDLVRLMGYGNQREEVGILTGGTAYPDTSCPGPFPKSPGSCYVIQVYPAHLDVRIGLTVAWNTQGMAPFREYFAQPAEERAAGAEAFNWEVLQYIENHQDQYRDSWWKMVSRVVVHEMGHGVGIRDLKPSLSGPMTCVMRYLSNEEIGIDANDRFGLRRRNPWPHIFCTSAEGSPSGKSCQQQIRFTDER